MLSQFMVSDEVHLIQRVDIRSGVDEQARGVDVGGVLRHHVQRRRPILNINISKAAR